MADGDLTIDFQRDPPCNPVPVRLRIRAGQMTSFCEIIRIFHLDAQSEFLRLHQIRQFIYMGRTQAVPLPCHLSVHPYLRLSGSLQKQKQRPPHIFPAYMDTTLIISLSLKGIDLCEPLRLPLLIDSPLPGLRGCSRQADSIIQAIVLQGKPPFPA